MSQTTTCLNCRSPIPVGQERCVRCRLAKRSIPGYREHRRVRAAVLAGKRVCWICGRPGTPEDPLTLDHVLARARGGKHSRRNGRPAHLSCNSAKGAGAPKRTGLTIG